MSKSELFRILDILHKLGIEKITFTGGELLICYYLAELLIKAKHMNLTSMIVSNGSLISKNFLQRYHRYIDWIGLSLDSAIEQTEYKLGREYGSHIQKIKEAT